jgi:hypothetical protein
MARALPKSVENKRQFRLKVGGLLTLFGFLVLSFPASGCLWPTPHCEAAAASCQYGSACFDPCSDYTVRGETGCDAYPSCHWGGTSCVGAAVTCSTLNQQQCGQTPGCYFDSTCEDPGYDCGDASDESSCERNSLCKWNSEQF